MCGNSYAPVGGALIASPCYWWLDVNVLGVLLFYIIYVIIPIFTGFANLKSSNTSRFEFFIFNTKLLDSSDISNQRILQ